MDTNRGWNGLPYHHKRVAVTKEITFDAAHRLEKYQGKCSNIHGHTYRLEVTISGFPNEIGLVIDFYEIKKMLDALIVEQLDHRYLNEVLPMMNATADNLVVWIWEQCEAYLRERGCEQRDCRLEEIRLFETSTSWATLKREWMYANE